MRQTSERSRSGFDGSMVLASDRASSAATSAMVSTAPALYARYSALLSHSTTAVDEKPSTQAANHEPLQIPAGLWLHNGVGD